MEDDVPGFYILRIGSLLDSWIQFDEWVSLCTTPTYWCTKHVACPGTMKDSTAPKTHAWHGPPSPPKTLAQVHPVRPQARAL